MNRDEKLNAHLDGELDDDTQQVVDDQLGQDPQLRADLDALVTLDEALREELSPLAGPLPDTSLPRRRRARRLVPSLGVAAAILLSCALLWWSQLPEPRAQLRISAIAGDASYGGVELSVGAVFPQDGARRGKSLPRELRGGDIELRDKRGTVLRLSNGSSIALDPASEYSESGYWLLLAGNLMVDAQGVQVQTADFRVLFKTGRARAEIWSGANGSGITVLEGRVHLHAGKGTLAVSQGHSAYQTPLGFEIQRTVLHQKATAWTFALLTQTDEGILELEREVLALAGHFAEQDLGAIAADLVTYGIGTPAIPGLLTFLEPWSVPREPLARHRAAEAIASILSGKFVAPDLDVTGRLFERLNEPDSMVRDALARALANATGTEPPGGWSLWRAGVSDPADRKEFIDKWRSMALPRRP